MGNNKTCHSFLIQEQSLSYYYVSPDNMSIKSTLLTGCLIEAPYTLLLLSQKKLLVLMIFFALIWIYELTIKWKI